MLIMIIMIPVEGIIISIAPAHTFTRLLYRHITRRIKSTLIAYLYSHHAIVNTDTSRRRVRWLGDGRTEINKGTDAYNERHAHRGVGLMGREGGGGGTNVHSRRE